MKTNTMNTKRNKNTCEHREEYSSEGSQSHGHCIPERYSQEEYYHCYSHLTNQYEAFNDDFHNNTKHHECFDERTGNANVYLNLEGGYTTHNLAIKDKKHCGALKEKPPLYEPRNQKTITEIWERLTGERFTGCSRCESGTDCETERVLNDKTRHICGKELEAFMGIVKVKRVYVDGMFRNQGYRYKSDKQVKVLREVLKITPYPSSLAFDCLALLIRLIPRSVQVWFQNVRQGGETKLSKEQLKIERKNASISTREIFEIFLRTCYDSDSCDQAE